MTRVALIRVEFPSTLNPCVSMPLGIHQLAAALERDGVATTNTLDMQVHRPGEIRAKLDALAAWRPDVVGISAVSHNKPLAFETAAFFRRRRPGARVVLGGPMVSADPGTALGEPAVDFAIAGEGDEAFPALVRALADGSDPRGIPGVVHRESGETRHAPPRPLSVPLDDLPLIAWDRIDFDRYAKFPSMTFRRSRFASIFTSRGCPFRCIFCHNIFGTRFRARTPDHVLGELHLLRERHGIRRIEVNDDNFNWDVERAAEILERVRDELPDVGLGFGNGLRADRLDERMVRLLKEARCYFLFFPFETSSPRLQKLIHKNLDLAKAEEAVRLTRKYGVYTWGVYMIGFPTETPEEMEATIRHAERMDVSFLSIQSANPFEGTRLREMMDCAVPSADLGNVHADYVAGGEAMAAVTNLKLRVMRARMLRPANWYYVANLFLWKLWWVGPKAFALHLASVVRDLFSRRSGKSVRVLEEERDAARNGIRDALRAP